MEREEDEGGMVGETFTDYVSAVLFKLPSFKLYFLILLSTSILCFGLLVKSMVIFFQMAHVFMLLCVYIQRPPKLSIGPPHPDHVVETSSLSAVQPPEPTYDLKIKDDLEISKALSCLQIETLVYACQVSFVTELRLWLITKYAPLCVR